MSAAHLSPDPDLRVHDPPWEPNMGRFARHLATQLQNEGHPWPDLAAALITARGTTSQSCSDFAASLQLDPRVLTSLEDGTALSPPKAAPMPDAEHRLLSTRFSTAALIAAELHACQERKKPDRSIAYISHLLAVAALILEDGGDEDQAIAGLLHDSVEDQGMTQERLQAEFGDEVARIVMACTDAAPEPDQVKTDWLPRKTAHLAKLRALPVGDAVFRVTVADKLHNCRDIVADLEREGVDRSTYFDRFRGGRDGTLWYYAQMAALLTAKLPESALTAALDATARTLHGLAERPFPQHDPQGS